jgi:hypothetical protein
VGRGKADVARILDVQVRKVTIHLKEKGGGKKVGKADVPLVLNAHVKCSCSPVGRMGVG